MLHINIVGVVTCSENSTHNRPVDNAAANEQLTVNITSNFPQ